MSKFCKKRKKNRCIKQEMAGKLLGYSALAGAVLSMGASIAEAAPVDLSSFGDSHVIDFNSDGTDDVLFQLRGSISTSFAYVGAYAVGLNGARLGKYSTVYGSIRRFAASESFGPGDSAGDDENALAFSSTYLGSPAGSGGPFLNQSGYLGVAFPETPGTDRFAWVAIETSLNIFGTSRLSITDYAFSAPDEAIHIGRKPIPTSVPEPGALALLAVGLPGLYAMRRRGAKERKSLNK